MLKRFCALLLAVCLAALPARRTDGAADISVFGEAYAKLDIAGYQQLKPNELGEVMILMYHGLYADEPPAAYHRTVAGFMSDLMALYDGGYRLISLKNLVENNIAVEPGYTPVVLTFDDGLASSLSLVETDGTLVPKPGCAVDIINIFSGLHPDFGRAATFFIYGRCDPFKGAGTLPQRLEYLVNNGYDIGNHTYSHVALNRLGPERVQEEIGMLDRLVREALPGYSPVCVSYPYGSRPGSDINSLVLKGEYGAVTYNYDAALRAGFSQASTAPSHIDFDPLNLPRIRGTANTKYDLSWFLDYYRKNPDKKYISDGNPDTVALPSSYQDKLNRDSLGEKIPVIYELP